MSETDSTNEPEIERSTNRLFPVSRKTTLAIAVLVLILGAVGLVAKLVSDNNKLEKQVTSLSQEKNTDSNEDAKKLIAEVGSIFELPADETPTIATVSDVDKLKAQSDLFATTKQGDRLLVYANAKLTVVYRPSAKKVIKVFAITTQTDTSQQKKN